MVKRETVKQFLKFSLVGILNTLIDWSAFLILTFIFPVISFEPYAKAISFSLGVLNSFLINSKWTFKKEYKKIEYGKKKIFLKFIAVNLIGLAINYAVFTLSRFSLNQNQIVSLLSATAISLLWNFSANKFWTYKK